MTRKELAKQAFDIIKDDFGGMISESKTWQVIAETDNMSLLYFVTDTRSRKEALDVFTQM